MQIATETITPQTARTWLLELNQNNQRPIERRVQHFAADMKNGRWKNCYQPISFDADGTLADGQHRLRAIVESGVTLTCLVARGVPRELVYLV
jgi:hypothetical protein